MRPKGRPWDSIASSRGPKGTPLSRQMAYMDTSKRPRGARSGPWGFNEFPMDLMNVQWIHSDPPTASARPTWTLRGGRGETHNTKSANFLRLHPREDERSVSPTKPKRIGKRRINGHITRSVGNVVEIAAVTGMIEVNRGRSYLVKLQAAPMRRTLAASHPLRSTREAQQ